MPTKRTADDSAPDGIPVSVVVMTKNEAANIEKCLDSVDAFNEVFVVDSGSEDRTVELAERAGAHVVDFQWDGQYPKKKQWSLENLSFSYPWVLFLDADEEVTAPLADEIADRLARNPAERGFEVGYDYFFLGRHLRHGHRIFKLVLFERSYGKFDPVDDLGAANMWEVEGHYQPNIDGKVGRLRSPMLHRDYDTLFHYLDRHNRYSDWEAVVAAEGVTFAPPTPLSPLAWGLMAAYRALPFKGALAFVRSFVLERGFLDGRPGFHFAVARGFYYWQIELKKAELARTANGGSVTSQSGNRPSVHS